MLKYLKNNYLSIILIILLITNTALNIIIIDKFYLKAQQNGSIVKVHYQKALESIINTQQLQLNGLQTINQGIIELKPTPTPTTTSTFEFIP